MIDDGSLSLKITQKISSLSQGLDDKINNAALQAKVVSELSSAVRTHLQKIVDLTSSNVNPAETLTVIRSAVQNLSGALIAEESRVRGNYDTLVARKQVIQEISIAVAEEFAAQELAAQAKAQSESLNPAPIQQIAPPIQDVPEVMGGSSPASSIYINEETSGDPEPKAEIPAHVSRFFNG